MGEDGTKVGAASVYGETWVFESLVGAIPGVDVSDRVALALQFVVFEVTILVVAAVFDRWQAVLPGTAAVVVATAGSGLMLDIGRRVRSTAVPRTYRQLLFSSSIEVVLGVVGYATVLTVLFVYQPRLGPTLLETYLGPRVPLLAAFLFFVILWDIAYRIGTGWWIALLGLWRSITVPVEPTVADELRAIDYRTATFGLVQLLLLPFLRPFPVLAALLLGHVGAVLLVLAGARWKTSH